MTCLEYISRPETMTVLGFLTHVVKKIARVKRDGHAVTPLTYLAIYPYQTFLALVGAVAGLGALHATGQLNAVSAFAAGYMANSVADMLGKRGKKDIEGP